MEHVFVADSVVPHQHVNVGQIAESHVERRWDILLNAW